MINTQLFFDFLLLAAILIAGAGIFIGVAVKRRQK